MSKPNCPFCNEVPGRPARYCPQCGSRLPDARPARAADKLPPARRSRLSGSLWIVLAVLAFAACVWCSHSAARHLHEVRRENTTEQELKRRLYNQAANWPQVPESFARGNRCPKE